ncbi:MAG TPA: acyl-CoA dehydrogenase [Bdellovibrionales bacterium]|nr:acyl-CoA dehydrogenase [Bdellovibrionales bacterium]
MEGLNIPGYGMLLGSHFWYAAGAILFLVLAFGYKGARLWLWSLLGLVALVGLAAPLWLIGATVAVALIFNIKPVRAALVSSVVMKVMKKILPHISETERTALEAGVVWVEKDLFSGRPDFKTLLNEPYPELTPEEKAFMDGPVERLCEILNDWDVVEKRELPKEFWDMIRKEKFFGMIIPKEYGGLGFSALAHAQVISKVTSRCGTAAVTIMVPNSLGPAELLIHYGTEAQKKNYLPKLATAEEIPCFALTEPQAGSDAGAIESSGVLFKGPDGKLHIRLNWNKRWITLAAISTTLGLAFKLRDPENLLGRGEDLGITAALIPSKTPGVVIGRRHDPLGIPFYNCPTQGHDVVIPVDQVVGGLEGVGRGWKMLMECLAAGRGISLPSQSAGGAKLVARVISAHASIRKQFGLPIGKFEGIEEPLARIAGFNYAMEAMRRFTLGGLDKGIKPPVITAIAKYNATELGRKIINDGMDIMGGAAISRGPRNTLANMYWATPIGITVEGANILTRTLIIFGQGALRAHPYAYKEVAAAEANDLKGFDDAFWSHIGHVVNNLFRSVLLSLTRGRLAARPVSGPTARYYQKLSWASASFAILADIAMAALGGALKQKETITGRFADILSWMYIGFSVLRRYEAEGRRKEDLPFVHYSMKYAFQQMQIGFDGIFANLGVPGLRWFFKGPLLGWSSVNSLEAGASDKLVHEVAQLLQTDGPARERLTEGIYMPKSTDEAVARLEHAFKVIKSSELSERKIRKAIAEGRMEKKKGAVLYDEALAKQVISDDEYKNLKLANEVRWQAIQVDDFSEEEFKKHSGKLEAAHAQVTLTPAAKKLVGV